MTGLKTKPTNVSVSDFLNKVEPPQKRQDSFEIVGLMEKITGEKAVMWGPSIVGFGKYHYKYASGHEGDMCITGFSPRKAAITIYASPQTEKANELIKKLGKHKASKACIYIKKLSDVNKEILEKLIRNSVDWAKKEYPQ